MQVLILLSDLAETEQDMANLINHVAVGKIAEACAQIKALLCALLNRLCF